MRINVYAEEMTERIEVITKTVEGIEYHALRFYLWLPVTTPGGGQIKGPFMHSANDDDSSAVTFWGSKRRLKNTLELALKILSDHARR